tara:strand:+ start:1785 stop:2756 length:972 start_codon:yes stop_codon:yes gene_type:complete
MNILITGSAGFIGYNLAKKLIGKKINVVGLDNLDFRTGTKLKINRLNSLKKNKNRKYFKFHKLDICSRLQLEKIFKKYKFKKIIHLAALAGVRNSFLVPEKYIKVNIIGSFNILENAHKFKIPHLILASTSSVYGKKKQFPIKEEHITDLPLSLYAATKKSMEVISHVYAHNFNLSVTILRFFTVYGPYGRPDMALYKFAKSFFDKKPIELFNKGKHTRDFTYIDDIVNSIEKLIASKKKPKYYDVFNLSNGKAVPLSKYVKEIEFNLGNKLIKKFMGLQRGDIHKTHGNNLKFKKKYNYSPRISVNHGVKNFIQWFKNYHKK